nr:MAG TPA: hypothetical protein [Caudoviricetes sp.]
MYLMFKYKNMMPYEFNKLTEEEKLLLNIFINKELEDNNKKIESGAFSTVNI